MLLTSVHWTLGQRTRACVLLCHCLNEWQFRRNGTVTHCTVSLYVLNRSKEPRQGSTPCVDLRSSHAKRKQTRKRKRSKNSRKRSKKKIQTSKKNFAPAFAFAWFEWALTALFTKPPSTVLPAVGTTLRDRSPLTASWHFQELYQAKTGTVLPVALWIAL